MIKTKKGVVTASGNKTDLMADLTTIIKELTDKHDLSKDDIDLCVKTAYLSAKEVRAVAMATLFSALFGDFEDFMKEDKEDGE